MGAYEIATETVARALVAKGALVPARLLLRAALLRDPRDPGCSLLLQHLATGAPIPPARVPLGIELVRTWTKSGRPLEALCVLLALELQYTAEGEEWARLLGELCAPSPRDAEPGLSDIHTLLYAGKISNAQERLQQHHALPAWASRRLNLLRQAFADPEIANGDTERPPTLAALLRAQLSSGSVHQAYDAAREYRDRVPDDPEAQPVINALKRLITAVTEASPPTGAATTAVGPLAAAQFHFTMGNLAEAEARAREVVATQPDDSQAIRFYDDLLLLRRVIAEDSREAARDRHPLFEDDGPATALVDVENELVTQSWSGEEIQVGDVELDTDPLGRRVPASHRPSRRDDSEAPPVVDLLDQPTRSSATAEYSHGLGVELTEQLGQRLIDEKRYEEALQVYMSLCAEFPKSAYYRARLHAVMNALDPETSQHDVTVRCEVPEDLRRRSATTDAPANGRRSDPVLVSRILPVGPQSRDRTDSKPPAGSNRKKNRD